MMTYSAGARASRAFLLAGCALGSLACVGAAKAQSDTPTAQAGATLEPQVVVSGPEYGHTPTSEVDQTDVTGIGQMQAYFPGMGISTCTGTLINPRTVLFAAHCVNTRNESDWGRATGGLPIAFAFRADNNAGWEAWYQNLATNIDQALYNVTQVKYHALSTALGADANFLQADIAIGTLETPAIGIPTWALLFSPLPSPDEIDPVNGTGYHVTIAGYGLNGVGVTGATNPVDNRRRVAENILGMLGSMDDFNQFLFDDDADQPQNLYQIDFDDPGRDAQHDINVFRDDAQPNEGLTAQGDSGGPLILDQTFAEQVLIGVLSGGGRVAADQAPDSFGSTSFYQPLFLWWDYIVANNPYRYVSAKAGDGNWSDPQHWVTTLDPAYRVLDANNQLVAGLPEYAGKGVDASDADKFGQLCQTYEGAFYCYDLATRRLTKDGVTVEVRPGTNPTPSPLLLPEATLANGLPGATGFVPNNVDPVRDLQTGTVSNGRYFDVTLSAAGTTTLDSSVTVDRFKIVGAQSALEITPTGSLTSLIDIMQLGGMVRVDGRMSTPYDYFVLTGGVTGTGTIAAPYFTSTAATIAPGTPGGIGTLTFEGTVILASGTRLMVDVGPDGASDRIVVKPGAAYGQVGEWWDTSGSADIVDGGAYLGGTVQISGADGYRVRAGDSFTILTAEGGIAGTFDEAALSAILSQRFAYSANAVTMDIEAGSYVDVLGAGSPIVSAYAGLLDGNRSASDAYDDLYVTLDLMSADGIRSTLGSLAPGGEVLAGTLGIAATDTMSSFIRSRLDEVGNGSQGGSLALYGQPVQLAALAATPGMFSGSPVYSDAAPQMRTGVLPDEVSAFLAGGYIDGDSAAQPAVGGRDQFDGFFLAGGIENSFADDSFIGLAFSYTDLDGAPAAAGQAANASLYQGTLYARSQLGPVRFDGQMSAGAFNARATRTATIGADSYAIEAEDTAFAFTSELGASAPLDLGAAEIAPRAALRYSHLGFTNVAETGGGPALQYNLGNYDSLQGRAGLDVRGDLGGVKPFVTATYVHDFKERPGVFGANFVGGIGPNALFALPGTDQDWGEVGGGLRIDLGSVEAAVSAETSIERSDISTRSYRGSLTVRF